MEALKKESRYYTYADYCTWDDDARYELINGESYLMSPAPTTAHQEISVELLKQLSNFLTGKPCKVFHAPVDVRLDADKADDTVVQPDILVVCDLSKLDGKSVRGAPDFIIEILSPSSYRRDLFIKLNKYMQAGVREYWVVNPEIRAVSAHILKDGVYMISAYGDENEAVPVHVLEGCVINLKEIFKG